MQTTHSHHLSLHSKSQLHELSPQLKILSTLLIVISIAFSKIINPFQIISHAVIVFLIIRFSTQSELQRFHQINSYKYSFQIYFFS